MLERKNSLNIDTGTCGLVTKVLSYASGAPEGEKMVELKVLEEITKNTPNLAKYIILFWRKQYVILNIRKQWP
jgi:hypothetical protein